MVDIIIPHYHEPESVIKNLLDSLEVQQDAEFKVIIINDGKEVILSEEFLKRYTFPIEYHIEEWHGLSAARNKGLEYATSDYVMFCDADDMFFHAYGLVMVSANIPFDVLISSFIEETPQQFIVREDSPVYVHGKVYRRKFLLDNQIRFNERLMVNEDSAFNMMCIFLSQNTKRSQNAFYIWKYREDSTVRKDPYYRQRSHPYLTMGGHDLVEEFLKRDRKADAASVVCAHVFNTYRMIKREEWQDELKKKALDAFFDFFDEFKYLWQETELDSKLFMLSMGENRGITLEEVDQFLQRA